MAVYRASVAASGSAEALTISHNLGNPSAVLVKATPNWPAVVYIAGAKTSNAIPVAFDVPAPSGGGIVDVEVQG